MKKRQTLEQLESTKAKAARFVENVLHDSSRADEIRDEDPESYASRKGIEILSNKERNMAKKRETVQELRDRIDELEAENDELNDTIDDIVARATGEDLEDEDGEDYEDEDLE